MTPPFGFLPAPVLLLLVLPLAAATQPPVTPADILRRVSAAVTPEVQFREVRSTRLLKTPRVSSGRLRYAPPGRLEKNTLLPAQESVVIDDLQVTIDRAGSQTVVSLVDGTPAAAMVQTLRAVLGGNAQGLEALYRASAQGTIERWTLHLEPRAGDGAVRLVRLSGSDGQVDEIEVLEQGGDKTVTTLSR